MASSATSQVDLQLRTVLVAYHLCLGEVDISYSQFLYLKNRYKLHISQSDRL